MIEHLGFGMLLV